MMRKLCRTIQKLYRKSPFRLLWVIRQCLHIDTNPGSSTKIKFILVVTWKFDLLKTFWFFHLFSLITKYKNKWKREWNTVKLFFLTRNDLREVIGRLCFRKMRNMREKIQANCSSSKTSGETDLVRNVWKQDDSLKYNSPHIKLALKELAPDSETNSPHAVILHNVLK